MEAFAEELKERNEAISKLVQELTKTKWTLEQSETCCSEWEKQALDYKAELTKTNQALDVAVDALNLYSTSSLSDMAKEALRIIKQITESRPENVQPDTKSRPVNVQK